MTDLSNEIVRKLNLTDIAGEDSVNVCQNYT
jgi:hypothetical protein